MSRAPKPIIVIKKVSGHGGHHGGAWKVAYADFVTAMMALFIVLWLLSSSAKVKKAVAGYFNDPKSSQKETGTSKTGDDDALPVDQKNVQKLKEQIQKAIQDRKDLEKLAKQIEITITPEGLRIELIEDKNGTFFQSGSAKLSETGQQLLAMLAGQLKPLPNHLLLEGHTDAKPYSADTGYTNWELSADRANSARRLLQADGVGQQQISQVRGYADQLLRVKNDPMDPTNRRISLIVQWVTSAEPPSKNVDGQSGKDLGGEIGKAGAAKTTDAKPAGGSSPQGEKPTGTAPGSSPAPQSGAAPGNSGGAAKPSGPASSTIPAVKPAAGKQSLLDTLKSKLPGGKPKP